MSFLNKTQWIAGKMMLGLLINGCVSPDQKMDLKTENKNAHIFSEEVQLIRSQILESSQLNTVIREEGVEFDGRLLNDPGSSKHYLNSLEMATNIGVYVSDLNYLFSYEEDEAKKLYLDAIFYLANKLDVENAFDRSRFDVLIQDGLLMKREKLDFLDTLVKEAEAKINSDSRAQLAALIVSGSWIEGMFINFSLANTVWPNEVIGKEMLVHLESYERIKKILKHFEDYQPCADRLAELEKLQPMIDMIMDQDVIEINENMDDIAIAVGELRMSLIKI